MSDSVEKQLAEASKGYLSKEEYKRRREEIEAQEALDKVRKAIPAVMVPVSSEGGGKKKKSGSKKERQPGSALSFGDELDGEAEPSPRVQPKKMGKCQDVDVSFLKKNEREAQEAAHKQEQAVREFLELQQKAKQEPITLKYTFRSEATQRELPNGVHQGTMTFPKGATAEEVAKAVRSDVEQIGEKFKLLEVAGKKEDPRLMLVVGASGMAIGSFIIPSAIALVEVASMRWSEGNSLFEDFKAGIIVTERRWYEQMRHTFPYSQWAVLDVHKSYSQKEFIANRNSGTGVDPFYRNGNIGKQRTGR